MNKELKLVFSHIAEGIIIDRSNKLSFINMFQNINLGDRSSLRFPIFYAIFGFQGDSGLYDAVLQLADAQGGQIGELINLKGLKLIKSVDEDPTHSVVAIGAFPNIEFKTTGLCSVKIWIAEDGQEIETDQAPSGETFINVLGSSK